MNVLEQAHCIKINLDNLVEFNPAIKVHPMFQIAYMQLEDLIVEMEKP